MTNATLTLATQKERSTNAEMFVIYRGKRYEVASTRYFCDPRLYGLKSRFSGGSIFSAKKDDCQLAGEVNVSRCDCIAIGTELPGHGHQRDQRQLRPKRQSPDHRFLDWSNFGKRSQNDQN